MRDANALIAYLESREDWAFGYGPEPRTHDCARFCGAGVEAVTGRNPLNQFSSQWTTKRGARRVIAAHGGLAKAVSEVMTEIPTTMAQRGDVALLSDQTLGLVEGETVVGLSPDGRQMRAPRASIIQAWTA